jgi:transposase
MNPGLILMQDGAPGHIAKETQVDLKNAGSILYFALHFSPDLNLIETVWDRMKDYIERYFPEDHSSYDKLRRVVKEA